jgi:hypothetical protein
MPAPEDEWDTAIFAPKAEATIRAMVEEEFALGLRNAAQGVVRKKVDIGRACST